ncbi:hypothetical protein chiPu_0010287 [Chiloscyllium punctatum]|uniref:Uncharacterized protein n=1 Tax=Chiloscyllium punctatum TaxID=137246 RepID=A0A401SN89_CHIPU|nr:hypothetical protein [Chiloscyllium punctatum]
MDRDGGRAPAPDVRGACVRPPAALTESGAEAVSERPPAAISQREIATAIPFLRPVEGLEVRLQILHR